MRCCEEVFERSGCGFVAVAAKFVLVVAVRCGFSPRRGAATLHALEHALWQRAVDPTLAVLP